MPSNNVFQYGKIRTPKQSAKKRIKTGKKMESTSFWNPESTALESGIQYPGSGIHSMESRIQDCPGFPYMGRFFDAFMHLMTFRFKLDHIISQFAGDPWKYFLCLRCNVFKQVKLSSSVKLLVITSTAKSSAITFRSSS